ncbi:DNA repair protein RecN [Magnetospira sp. QH-2]|uniref:DNA repair protein RecN n=1 Tax=Magnetospira sp. (strain QH-2) TaxID=1288970 RepID=UPI0003E810AE|nr:DNA repair protein RecN [Magnetospira sp. QH-2]CCQ72795.1 DNA repair protein RecN (Recombination protein N) [Magnetospira sp. QH-2]
MLASLSIRDVVLIDRLDLHFQPGLCVLTGETGAGKSILLDALGLALGQRAEARLVRHGTAQASVTAAFDLAPDHPARVLVNEQGLDAADGDLILRRVVNPDGRSKAWVNDQPASVGLLKQLGAALVEVHGQFDTQGLLDPASHRAILDNYAGLHAPLAETGKAHRTWTEAERAVTQAEADLEQARRDEDFLRHAVEELHLLAPEPGEEQQLAENRTMMQNGEKLIEAMSAATTALDKGNGVENALRTALRQLERIADKMDGRLDEAIEALDRAAMEVAEGRDQIQRTAQAVDLDPRHLDQVEERLFALRAAARKHNVAVDSLAALLDRLNAQLNGLEDDGAQLETLRKEARAARETYLRAADRLTQGRRAAAGNLDRAVAAELPPLKLERAVFATHVETRDDPADWGPQGRDRVAFRVSTNPGSPPGALNKIASGGELARFMLALKACLADADPIPTLVFDEVDSGVGGAVAHAVGERLGRLAHQVQVLVVTHSPQVAARGSHHWKVSKAAADEQVRTTVSPLDDGKRREEVARMLSGAEVTEAARAAADSLLDGAP